MLTSIRFFAQHGQASDVEVLRLAPRPGVRADGTGTGVPSETHTREIVPSAGAEPGQDPEYYFC